MLQTELIDILHGKADNFFTIMVVGPIQKVALFDRLYHIFRWVLTSVTGRNGTCYEASIHAFGTQAIMQ